MNCGRDVNSKENPVYIWLAIARSSRQIVGFYLGDPAGISQSERAVETVREHFGRPYPKIIKIMGNFIQICGTHIAMYCKRDRHYPSTKKSGETTKIERLNNTLRHRCSRLVRKNLAFSKNFFNHEGAILYFIHHYNEEILST